MAVVVHLTGETKELEASLSKASKKVEEVGESAEKAEGRASKFGSALGGAGKIAGGFVLGSGILAAPGFLMGAAEAAAADEQASARLAQTLQNLGGDVEGLTQRVNERIDAGQALAFSDDEVRDSFQYLAQATNDGDEALKRQTIAMDLARGAGISLDAASKMLGKTSEENINTLKKLGIEVADGASEADVLAGVQARFAGQSEAYAKSTAGQFEQAKLAMGEIVEGIGGAVLPILATVGSALAAHLPAIQAFAGEFGTAIGDVIIPAIGALLEFIGPVLAQAGEFFQTELLPRIEAFMAWLGPQLEELGAWIEEQFAKFQVYYESDIKPALENIQAGVAAVIGFIVEHWPEIWSVVEPVMQQVGNIVETVVKVVMEVFQILIDLISGDFSGAWENLKDLVGVVWDYIKETIANSAEFIKNLAPILLEAGKALGGALMDGLKEALSATAGFAGDIGEAVLQAVKGVINTYVIDPLNGALQFDFDTHIPGVGKIGVNAPDIPRLAKGGIVTKPTLAIIGEAGPEAVVPLSSANAKGGSLLGIGNAAPGVSGAKTAADPKVNLSLSELKRIADFTNDTKKNTEVANEHLSTMEKALFTGSNSIGDLIGQIADGMETLPALYQVLAEIRDLLAAGNRTAFGDGTV